jgi:hypothetical protein
MATYNIHFNGGVPHIVFDFADNQVRVYDTDSQTSKSFAYDHFYPGKDHFLVNGEEDDEEGHTCLINKGDHYIFVGGEKLVLFKLKENDTFLHFCSYIGNSDVPYAYIIGKEYVYFLTVDDANVVVIPEKNVYNDEDGENKYKKDPYQFLYNCYENEEGSNRDMIETVDSELVLI